MLISSLFFENRVIPSVMLLRDEHKNPSIFAPLCRGGGGGGGDNIRIYRLNVGTKHQEIFDFYLLISKKNCKIKEEIRQTWILNLDNISCLKIEDKKGYNKLLNCNKD